MRWMRSIAWGLAILLATASSLPAGQQATVELADGSKVVGELLKKDEKNVYMLIAGKAIVIDREKIKLLETDEEESKTEETQADKLYQTTKRAIKAVTAHAKELGPAIVIVKTPSGLGTGWFCNPNGYVVTNKHVISGEQAITVTAFKPEGPHFEKKVYKKVRLVALDGNIDLALLKIEEDLEMTVPALSVGDSDKVEEGDKVFTIGNPQGLDRSTSEGIISKARRNQEGRLYIQTTAPIAPGNSGGPLFNERGEVIGVVNMGYIYLDGLGFAIPSRYIKEFLDNVEAFAFDPDNPNSGVKYMEPPVIASDDSFKFTDSEFIKVSHGVSCLTVADLWGDGSKEILFANNAKGEIGILRRRQKAAEVKPKDFEDINKLPESERFQEDTYAVNDKIFSIVVTDMNADKRLDIVYYGAMDGINVMKQKADRTFGTAQKIADLNLAKRVDALRAADFDGDGRNEVFALGTTEFNLIRSNGERKPFPLSTTYRDRITAYDFQDVQGDGRLDIIMLCASPTYAARLLCQKADGSFVEEDVVPIHLSGAVTPYKTGAKGIRFLSLDMGKNRAHELTLTTEKMDTNDDQLDIAVQGIPLSPGGASNRPYELVDLKGNGKLEVVTINEDTNEFVILALGEQGFEMHRSPAPQQVIGFEVAKTADGKAALICFSQKDKLFGISRIDSTRVTYPRPLNVDGQVEYLWAGQMDGGDPVLLWVEKVEKKYLARMAPAAALAEKAFDGEEGSIDLAPATLRFGKDAEKLKDELKGKPEHLEWADLNNDGKTDLIIRWAYSGKESLYKGLGDGAFQTVIADQEFLELQKDQPLLTADIDVDGKAEVLLVQPGFVRVIKMDDKEKLYVERQFNWPLGVIDLFVPYSTDPVPRFLVRTKQTARIVEFADDVFKEGNMIDLTGLSGSGLDVGDLDSNGTPDIIMMSGNTVNVLYSRTERQALESKIVFNARLDNFNYWNIRAMDLDGDAKDEVLLFDSNKAMFEILRPGEDGQLGALCRHRLFEKTIYQRRETGSYNIPQELAAGDVDGNKKTDLVFILQDRIAIYLQ